ncbi:MAG: DUF2909 domain-containing protein [Pseudomonadales bacterium]
MLKIAVFVLFLSLIASLASGLFFLFKDQGATKRTYHSLGFRVSLAIAMMVLLGYGVYSGEITPRAPWDAKLKEASQAQQQ